MSDLVSKSYTATSLAYCIDSCSGGLGQHVGVVALVGGGYVQSSEMQGLVNVNKYQLEGRNALVHDLASRVQHHRTFAIALAKWEQPTRSRRS